MGPLTHSVAVNAAIVRHIETSETGLDDDPRYRRAR
jgi:hypothetical protein